MPGRRAPRRVRVCWTAPVSTDRCRQRYRRDPHVRVLAGGRQPVLGRPVSKNWGSVCTSGSPALIRTDWRRACVAHCIPRSSPAPRRSGTRCGRTPGPPVALSTLSRASCPTDRAVPIPDVSPSWRCFRRQRKRWNPIFTCSEMTLIAADVVRTVRSACWCSSACSLIREPVGQDC